VEITVVEVMVVVVTVGEAEAAVGVRMELAHPVAAATTIATGAASRATGLENAEASSP
jgi:hypothetical protein